MEDDRYRRYCDCSIDELEELVIDLEKRLKK